MIGWPGVSHQKATTVVDVMRIVSRYEPSKVATGTGAGSVWIVPIEPGQPLVISIRTIGHSQTFSMSAILYLVARLARSLIVWFPWMLVFPSFSRREIGGFARFSQVRCDSPGP